MGTALVSLSTLKSTSRRQQTVPVAPSMLMFILEIQSQPAMRAMPLGVVATAAAERGICRAPSNVTVTSARRLPTVTAVSLEVKSVMALPA